MVSLSRAGSDASGYNSAKVPVPVNCECLDGGSHMKRYNLQRSCQCEGKTDRPVQKMPSIV